MRDMFDRVYLISLKRRADRLANFRKLQNENGWRLPEVQVFEAIDGNKVGCPTYFREGGGAFGCKVSHIHCLERACMDDLETVLILEDDATFFPSAWDRLEDFMQAVPSDWDALWLGGQHTKTAKAVKPGVQRVIASARTHAYAVRACAIKSLLALWYPASVHIDWPQVLGVWQASHKVYSPDPFIFGQAAGKSDISGANNPPKYWIPPGEMPVIHLTAPPEVVKQLRAYGFHTGHTRDAQDIDVGLQKVARLPDKVRGLRSWLDTLNWECASDPGTVSCVWHPEITADMVRKATSQVVEVKGDTLEACLALVPKDLKLKKNLTGSHILVLRASREVVDHLPGFFRGNWRAASGHDYGQLEAAALVGEARTKRLQKWLADVTPECERMEATPMVWLNQISVEDVRLATDRKVVEIEASSVDETLEKWRASA